MMTVSSALRAARTESGLTQREVAAALGITAQYMSDLESGRRTMPEKYIERLPDVIRRRVASVLTESKLAELAELQKWAY